MPLQKTSSLMVQPKKKYYDMLIMKIGMGQNLNSLFVFINVSIHYKYEVVTRVEGYIFIL